MILSSKKNVLRISHVTLKNFRAYAGEIEFDLSLDPLKTITIIHGEMGLGKTTILDAIYWCLYNKERSKKGIDVITEEGIINTNILENLRIKDKEETFVEILLHDEEGIRFKIRRGIKFSKQTESTDRIPNESLGGKVPGGMDFSPYVEFHYLTPSGLESDWVVFTIEEKVQEEIEKIFPEALSSYFLFDAELLNDFFYTEADEHVKNGIEKISGLPILDDTKDHLKNTARLIQKSIANKEVSIKPIADDVAKFEEAISDYKKQLKEANERLAEIKSQKNGIQDYLRQHDDQEINSLQKQVDGVNVTLKEIDKAKKENDANIIKFLLEPSYKLLLRDSILETEKKFQKWENEGRIPLAVSKIALQNILSSEPPICICGTVIKDGSSERHKIDDLMSRVVDSSLIQHITVGRSILSNISDATDTQKLSATLGDLRSKRGEFRKAFSEKKAIRDSFQQKLDNHNIDEVQEKAKMLHNLEQQEISLYGNRKTFQQKIDFGEKDLKGLKRQLDNLTGKSQKYQSENNKSKIAIALSVILEQCREELVDQLRNITAETTTRYFLELISKKEDFSRVDILSNYQTIALDTNEKIKSLSAGQSCCLALSYIAAIREIANRNYFMMIDSPLHNISQEERVDIAQNLPSFLPGTQITLLVQDQEYTGRAKKKITGTTIPSVRDTLQKNNTVWREYLLESTKQEGDAVSNTTIRQIKNGEP